MSTETRPCGCATRGRHKSTCTAANATPAATIPTIDVVWPTETATDTAETWYGLPCMPDDEMEQYGGDLAALDSYSEKSRRHFATWREFPPTASAQPDLSPRGLLVNRHDPTLKFHFAFLEEDGSPHYRRLAQTMRLRGYKPATLDDFYVHSLLRDSIVPEDGTRRLTLGALKGAVTVIYVQDEKSYRKILAIVRRQSDEIQKTAEQKTNDLQEQARRDGFGSVTMTSAMEDDREAAQLYNR
jgi:hypothetical protein